MSEIPTRTLIRFPSQKVCMCHGSSRKDIGLWLKNKATNVKCSVLITCGDKGLGDQAA